MIHFETLSFYCFARSLFIRAELADKSDPIQSFWTGVELAALCSDRKAIERSYWLKARLPEAEMVVAEAR
jgi:hypothetical protein